MLSDAIAVARHYTLQFAFFFPTLKQPSDERSGCQSLYLRVLYYTKCFELEKHLENLFNVK